jgi:hypothetical protein
MKYSPSIRLILMDPSSNQRSTWQIPNGVSWESTSRVSEWNFVGNDNVWPCTFEDAKKYLPKEAL